MSEHIETLEPTFSLEAITLLNLFLKHSPEQKQLIFQFPIRFGKSPSGCHRLGSSHKGSSVSSFSSLPQSQIPRNKELSDYPGAECSSGLADKTVQHDRGKKAKF